MVNKIHYRWDFFGLSTDTKPMPEDSPKVVNGSTYYESDTSKLFVFYKDTWYERKPLGGGGGGSINVVQTTGQSTTDVMSQKAVTDALASGEATELTSTDYDYPVDSPNRIAAWRLDTGLYQVVENSLRIGLNNNMTLTYGTGTYIYVVKGNNNANITILEQYGNINYVTDISTGNVVYDDLRMVSVVNITGTSQRYVMSQNAVSSLLFDDPTGRTKVKIGDRSYSTGSHSVAIGHWSQSSGNNAVAIGGGSNLQYAAYAQGIGGVAVGGVARITPASGGLVKNYNTAIGYNATAGGADSNVAIGAYAKATEKGQFDISTLATTNTYGYNDSQYRLLTGLYDGQSAHDAVTVEQVNATIDAINTALSTSIPHIGA